MPHCGVLAAALLLHVADGLLSDGTYRVQSPCPAATAKLLATAAADSSDDTHWCAVLPGLGNVKPLEMAMFTAPMNPTTIGAPTAVARLDLKDATLGNLQCGIPKEEPEAAEVLGLAVDSAIEAWLKHCASSGTSFEALCASTTPWSAEVLRSRGFAEMDDSEIDFTTRPIVTHRARLPSAIVAYERRASTASDVLDAAMAQSLLDALRVASPVQIGGGAAASSGDEDEAPKRDPWAGIKGFGF